MKRKNIENNTIVSLVLAIIAWTLNYLGLIFGIISLIFHSKIKNKSTIEANISFWVAITSIIYNLILILINLVIFFFYK